VRADSLQVSAWRENLRICSPNPLPHPPPLTPFPPSPSSGGGIAGLTLALGLLRQGVRVQVLERDFTAVKGEGKLRGPIQVGSKWAE